MCIINHMKKPVIKSPFGKYITILEESDKDIRNKEEFGSFLILSLVEEIGEMTRAYLAKHGRKPTNLAAQKDETYEQELGDIVVSVIRFSRIKNFDLHKGVMYTLEKIAERQTKPKQ